MSFCIDNDDGLLEKYKSLWAKIEQLKYVELSAMQVHDDKQMKTKIK